MDRTFAVVGLGRIGGGLALQALRKGMRVAGYDRAGARAPLRDAGLVEVTALAGLRDVLAAPRAVFLYVPAGAPVDAVLETLARVLEAGDVVVDGGNSYWGDSARRAERLRARGIGFVDLGTSGGIAGAERGACFMAGGDPAWVARVEPILRALSAEGGFVHCGPSGTGHFTKLVHNGIEFGMLQAIGEGLALLEAFPARVDVAAVLGAWRRGSVIRSWLMDLLHAEYQVREGTGSVPPHVDDTGEVNWLVADALRMEVPIPVISQAVMELFSSRDVRRIASRAVAMMRHGFGGHPYGRDAGIARLRHTSQIDPRPPPAIAPTPPIPRGRSRRRASRSRTAPRREAARGTGRSPRGTRGRGAGARSRRRRSRGSRRRRRDSRVPRSGVVAHPTFVRMDCSGGPSVASLPSGACLAPAPAARFPLAARPVTGACGSGELQRAASGSRRRPERVDVPPRGRY